MQRLVAGPGTGRAQMCDADGVGPLLGMIFYQFEQLGTKQRRWQGYEGNQHAAEKIIAGRRETWPETQQRDDGIFEFRRLHRMAHEGALGGPG